MDKEQIIDALARWIDTQVIAEAIVDYLESEEMELTLQNGKDAWLAQLEDLLT